MAPLPVILHPWDLVTSTFSLSRPPPVLTSSLPGTPWVNSFLCIHLQSFCFCSFSHTHLVSLSVLLTSSLPLTLPLHLSIWVWMEGNVPPCGLITPSFPSSIFTLQDVNYSDLFLTPQPSSPLSPPHSQIIKPFLFWSDDEYYLFISN